MTFSDVEGGFSGTGNINANPYFVQLGYWDATDIWVEGDYHLLPDSPCIDTGDPAYVPAPDETDIDGGPRVINGIVDMGAYEYEGSSEPDTNAPVPDPMTWATLPYATGPASIAMAAAAASDASGVEYYFACIAGGGYDSGWQNSAFYEDTGLQPDTLYTYLIQARDKSANHNVTGWSSEESATTYPGCGAATMHVGSIVCDTLRASRGMKYGRVTVTIYDNCGALVSGASVTGTFTGDFDETLAEMTNGSGVAVLTTTTQAKKASYAFCVDDVSHVALAYDSNDNVESCDSN